MPTTIPEGWASRQGPSVRPPWSSPGSCVRAGVAEMPENFLERVRQVAGAPVLPDLAALDLGNDLHVDRAAGALLQRFQAADDVEAFKLLLELTADRLGLLAEEIAREQGLVEPPDTLVS